MQKNSGHRRCYWMPFSRANQIHFPYIALYAYIAPKTGNPYSNSLVNVILFKLIQWKLQEFISTFIALAVANTIWRTCNSCLPTFFKLETRVYSQFQLVAIYLARSSFSRQESESKASTTDTETLYSSLEMSAITNGTTSTAVPLIFAMVAPYNSWSVSWALVIISKVN